MNEKLKGALSDENYQFSDTDYYRAFPEMAVKHIRHLEQLNDRALEAGKMAGELIDELFAALLRESAVKGHLVREVERVKPLVQTEAKRRKNLNQAVATETNRLRAERFDKNLTQFVNGRIKDNPALSPKELTREVRQ